MPDYTNTELDQLAGALLSVGTWNGALGHMLDVTSDWTAYGLFEFINHMPIGPAVEILTTIMSAGQEVKARLEVMLRAVDAAMDSTAERAAIELTRDHSA